MKINDFRYDAMETAIQRVYPMGGEKSKLMEIYKIGPKFGKKEPVTFGINWSACGTQTVEKTMEFIENLQRAVKVVTGLNDLELEVVRVDEDETLPDKEAFDRLVDAMVKALECGYFSAFVRALCEE